MDLSNQIQRVLNQMKGSTSGDFLRIEIPVWLPNIPSDQVDYIIETLEEENLILPLSSDLSHVYKITKKGRDVADIGWTRYFNEEQEKKTIDFKIKKATLEKLSEPRKKSLLQPILKIIGVLTGVVAVSFTGFQIFHSGKSDNDMAERQEAQEPPNVTVGKPPVWVVQADGRPILDITFLNDGGSTATALANCAYIIELDSITGALAYGQMLTTNSKPQDLPTIKLGGALHHGYYFGRSLSKMNNLFLYLGYSYTSKGDSIPTAKVAKYFWDKNNGLRFFAITKVDEAMCDDYINRNKVVFKTSSGVIVPK